MSRKPYFESDNVDVVAWSGPLSALAARLRIPEKALRQAIARNNNHRSRMVLNVQIHNESIVESAIRRAIAQVVE